MQNDSFYDFSVQIPDAFYERAIKQINGTKNCRKFLPLLRFENVLDVYFFQTALFYT